MIDPNRLYTALLNTGLQNKNPQLYQVIHDLIGQVAKLNPVSSGGTGGGSSTTNITNITNTAIIQSLGETDYDSNELGVVIVPGNAGPTGSTGSQGIQGVPGLLGFSGLDGEDGLDGVPGPQGARGIQGIQGLIGPVFIPEDGFDGSDGAPGPIGITGATGPATVTQLLSNATGTQNNFNFNNADIVVFYNNAGVTITGLLAGTPGQRVTIVAGSITGVVTLVHSSGSSAAANLLQDANQSGVNVTRLLQPQREATTYQYFDGTSVGIVGRWKQIETFGPIPWLDGIQFPATQAPSSNANTLDDYREGTWTPVDNSGAGLTFTGPVGEYTTIGQMVFACCALTYPVTASGLGALIGGLPYTSKSSANNMWGAFCTFTNAPGGLNLRAVILIGTTNLYMNLPTGVQATNAQLSTAALSLVAVYPKA